MSSDQCANNSDSSLKDAKDIQYLNDPDDSNPLPTPTAEPLVGLTTVPLTGMAVKIRQFNWRSRSVLLNAVKINRNGLVNYGS